MEDYSLIDAALDGVHNYMKALNAEASELEIYLQPHFNEDWDAIRMDYSINLHTDNMELDHTFKMSQSFEKVDSFDNLDYSTWVNRFVEEFPESTVHYFSTPALDPLIEETVTAIKTYLGMFHEETESVSVLIDPEYDKGQEVWEISYNVRANISSDGSSSGLDVKNEFQGGREEFLSVYPLWIKAIRDKLPEADLFYPEADDL